MSAVRETFSPDSTLSAVCLPFAAVPRVYTRPNERAQSSMNSVRLTPPKVAAKRVYTDERLGPTRGGKRTSSLAEYHRRCLANARGTNRRRFVTRTKDVNEKKPLMPFRQRQKGWFGWLAHSSDRRMIDMHRLTGQRERVAFSVGPSFE